MRFKLVSVALALGLLLPSIGEGGAVKGRSLQHEYERLRSDQLTKVAKTQGLLAEKYTQQEAEMKARVRTMYKLTRSSWPRLWFEPTARQNVAQWLGAARRIRNRDRYELAILREEIAVANLAQETLEGAQIQESELGHSFSEDLKGVVWPVLKGTLVSSFGLYKGPSHRVKLRQRGITISSHSGTEVVSIADGQVRYVGPISGLGTAMLIDHKGFLSVVGHLQSPAVKAGERVKRGRRVALANGSEIYLEIRVNLGPLGHVIDPMLFLAK